MPVVISDSALVAAGLDEKTALIEIACWLFDADKISLPAAGRMAGMERMEFEEELNRRGIAAYRITPEYWEQELKSIEKLWGTLRPSSATPLPSEPSTISGGSTS